MNNNDPNIFCPRCGNKLLSYKNCSNCGYILEISNSSQVVNGIYNKRRGTLKKSTTFVIISVVNIFILIPIVVLVFVMSVFYGALTNNVDLYPIISPIIFGYLFASVVSLISSIINVFKKGKILKKCLSTIVISFFIGCLMPLIIDNLNISFKSLDMNKSQIEEKEIFSDTYFKVKQKSLDYDKDYVKLKFKVNELSNYNFQCNSISKVRINKYYFHKLSLDTDQNTGDCILYMDYSYLNRYNIKDIYLIDLWLPSPSDNIVSFKTDSKKHDNGNDIAFKSLDANILYENQYFKVFINPDYKYNIELYVESKIKDDYELEFTNEDIDTYGYQNVDNLSTTLYDYTIFQNVYTYHPCRENLSYYNAHYKILDKYKNIVYEGEINQKYDKPFVTTQYCLVKD